MDHPPLLICTSDPDNGLVRDKTHPTTPASIFAMGLALTTLPVFVERGVIIREYVAKIARRKLRYLYDCPQGREADASGYKGPYYHFLDMNTGRRAGGASCPQSIRHFCSPARWPWQTYFYGDSEDETEVRRLADAIYRRADWDGRSRSWTEDARA